MKTQNNRATTTAGTLQWLPPRRVQASPLTQSAGIACDTAQQATWDCLETIFRKKPAHLIQRRCAAWHSTFDLEKSAEIDVRNGGTLRQFCHK
jgi:hypothetical protein